MYYCNRNSLRHFRQKAFLPLSSTIIMAALLVGGCDFPYSPQRQPDPYRDDTTPPNPAFSGTATIYPVNTLQQSCNPSIAPHGPYNGSLLFLGYDRLSLRIPPENISFPSAVSSHDRLTIVDTTNTVRWFFLREELAPAGDLQCPEWSTHHDYIAFLLGRINRPYSGYAVRISDRQTLKICDNQLEEFSTPHLWTGDTISYPANAGDVSYTADGFADRAAVQRFFGTSAVSFVYTLPARTGTIYHVDYRNDATPLPRSLAKPSGRENWYCASPLISPDGNWVTYHCYSNPTKGPFYASYIQRLEPGAPAQLVADGASDPHWWTDPRTGNHFIIYTVTYDNYFTEFDFADSTIARSNLAGCTLRRRLAVVMVNGETTLSPDTSSPPDTLIRLPFKGGLSHDGRYLATAYKYTYIARLNDK